MIINSAVDFLTTINILYSLALKIRKMIESKVWTLVQYLGKIK